MANAQATAGRAKVAVSKSTEAVADVSKQMASAEGALHAIDVVALETRMLAASQHPAMAEPEAPGPDVASALEEYELSARKLQDCEGRLHAAKGQLELVGGHAVAERLARQEEVVALARQEYEEKELTGRAALHLLNEIKVVEAEATSSLGRTLAGPVTQMLQELTGGRYGMVEFATDLTAAGVSAAGAARDLDQLSVGTKEQLATLVRLAIAAQLQTALVLDDQLVHGDTERLQWFRDRLCKSAQERQHQMVVITCRLGDYLPRERSGDAYSVDIVDLLAVIDASA